MSIKKLMIIGLLFFGFGSLFADQTSVDRMLKENKEYISFLDVCMTNFGEKEKDKFFELYEMHFNADISYLQSDYKRAYSSLYNSQKKQALLYPEVLAKYYLEDSKNLLDKIAPEVIKSKKASARHYLTLGYRDRATSRNFQIMADAQNPRQFSEKIFRYEEAIKIARRSMRFALISLFESRDNEMKKYIYGHLFETERETQNVFYSRFVGKTGEQFVAELNIPFKEYETRYQQEQSAKSKSAPAPVVSPAPAAKGAAAAPTEAPVSLTEPAPKTPEFEGTIEREVRFRQEKRVAEYLRDGEFGKADDIIIKYIDDFNFKMIKAMIEVLKAKQKDSLQLEFDKLQLHHMDNFSRLTRQSMADSFATQLKVRDDVKVNTNPQQQSAPAQPAGAAKPADQPGGTVQPSPAASGQPAAPKNPGTK